LEQLLAALAIGGEGQPRQGSKEPHKIGEVIDRPASGDRIRFILRVRDALAGGKQLPVDARGHLRWEEVIGNPHLVRIRIAGESHQAGHLRLPAEPADALRPRRRIDDEGRAAADAIGVRGRIVGQGANRFRGNGRRDMGGDDVGVGRGRKTCGSGFRRWVR